MWSTSRGGLKANIGAELGISLADALGVPVRWLLLGDPMSSYYRLSSDEVRLLNNFRRLTPALRKHFLESLNSLAAIQPTASDPFPTSPRRD